MSYFEEYIAELATGLATLLSSVVALLILHWANFKPRHIEIAVKRKWPHMPYIIIKLVHYIGLLLLVFPLAMIIMMSYGAWRGVFNRSYSLAIGTGTLLFMIYIAAIGFFSWARAMWTLTWLQTTCFCFFVGGILVFSFTHNYLDEAFDYETHSVVFFVGSLVFMVLFTYSLSARSALDLNQLYCNFLLYYEKKLKERPAPVQAQEEEEEKIEAPNIDPLPMQEPEDAEKQESDKSGAADQNHIEKKSEVNMINMSLVLSKVSMESGEKSHSGNVPQAFPGFQANVEPESYTTPPSLPAEVRYKQEFQEILNMTTGYAKTYETLKCLFYLLVVAGMYAVYNAEYRKNNTKKAYTLIGVVQTCYLIYFDTLIILWSRSRLRKSPASITESSILMLICRMALSFSLRYWVSCHCIVYIILTTIIATSIWPVSVAKKEGQAESTNIFKRILERFELHYAMLLIAIGATTFFSFMDHSTIRGRVPIDEVHEQTLACLFVALYAVNFVLFQFMARIYKKNNYQFTAAGLILFVVAWGIALACGFALRSLSPSGTPKYIVYIVAFFSCPIVGLAIIIFSRWIHNDYTYYENPASELASNNNPNTTQKVLEQPWWKMFSGLIPKTVADLKVFLSVLLEVVVLILYAVILQHSSSEKIIPYIISSWLLILWATLTWAIRFVHTFYQIDGFMVFKMVIAVILMALLFLNVYRFTNSYKSFLFYFVVTVTLLYTVSVCCVLAFYIFVDMDFDFTCACICLTSTSAVFVELWAVLTFLISGDFYFLPIINIFLVTIGYMFFLYTRWKSNDYNLPFRYTLLNICLVLILLGSSLTFLFIRGDTRGLVYSMYGILGGLAFAYFCRYMNFFRKSRKENHQQCITTTTIFPVFRYDTERAQMVQADDVPLYTFVNLGIVIFWSMLVCILSVKFYLFGLFLMCLAFSFGAIYSTEMIYKSKWIETSTDLESLNAKDLYLCLKQSVLSSMIGTTPPRDEGEIDIESAVGTILRLFTQTENVESWWVLRTIQCYELGDFFCCCSSGHLELNDVEDELLYKAATKTRRLNPNLAEITPDYMEQLNNLELIDKTIEERTLIRAKRIASFIAQVRLTIKARSLQNSEQKDAYLKMQKSGNRSPAVVPSSGLNFIPRNVKYEAGSHIELDLIGASIFMPWKWLRVKEFYPKSANICVFSNMFAGDVKQGEFGDCWIIAAMTMLAVHAPHHLVDIFANGENTEYSANGKYVLKLYVDGEPKNIVVDDYFPCLEQATATGDAAESEYKLLAAPFQYDQTNNRKIIWPMLIEKALATEYGSYENLNGGVIDDALNLLTGTAAFRYNLLNEDVRMRIADGSLWRKMMEYNNKCFLMGAGSLPKEMMPQNNMGIIPCHAYAVMDVFECDSHKLVELKNPWGQTYWSGNWSAFSNTWTRRIREMVSQHKTRKKQIFEEKKKLYSLRRPLVKVPEGSGKCFYMCLEDFIQYFEVIFFTIFFDESWEKQVIKDSWTAGRSGGSTINLETVRCNPQYLIKVEQTTETFFLLHQIAPYSKLDLPIVGFELYKYEGKLIGDSENPQPELVGSGMYAQERNISLEKTLEAGNYILLVTTYYPDIWEKFTVTIWGKKNSTGGSTFSYVRLN